MKKYGTGSDLQQAIQSANAALQGVIGGNIGAAAAGASAPYLAQAVKNLADQNFPIDKEHPNNANLIAKVIGHAIVGAVVAQTSGNDALSGALGGSSGELIAMTIAKERFGKEPEDLTEAERQFIVNITAIASGVATGIIIDSTAGAATGAAAGQNAAKNNAIVASMTGKTDEEIRQEIKNQFDSACSGNLKQCQDMLLIGGTLAFLPVLPEAVLISGSVGGGANIGIQYLANGTVDPRDAVYASWVGMATAGSGFWGTVSWNTAGGALSSYTKDENPLVGGLVSGAGSSIGYGIGKLTQGQFNKVMNENWKNWSFTNPNLAEFGISQALPQSSFPSVIGNIANSGFTEISIEQINKKLDSLK
ncbi:VENN motif pre-toxin domain-containing protein [Pragia fontium]|uniref:Pre-toxin domain with VENN motif-containing protein n=1 Tax=Pragia fontium DSM 5563 = ATCC 49100 TaxID=1122977 RepID=A0AAJ4WAD1_9GAMM|nr:VENN motif pre-toxin domain-containing protein [Pragia fontium]SFC76634.1 Pre-toxin domain with VENN motif-containing protein [Pragia fontium DSM 5563 = ATCC 49100]